MPDFYEQHLCYMSPASEIYFELEKIEKIQNHLEQIHGVKITPKIARRMGELDKDMK